MSLKEILKRSPLRDLAVSALHLGGMTKPHKAHRGRMCAVSLHRVLPAELLASYPIPGIAMTTDEFRWFLDYFSEYFRPTTVRDGYRALLGDEAKDDPRPLLAVTFDDGQLDNFLYAAPLLSEFNIKATFCVPTDGIECQETLWHDRLGFSVRSLLAEGTWDASGFSARLGLAREQAHSPAEWVQAAKGLSVAERKRFVEEVEAASGASAQATWDGFMTWEQLRELHAQGHEIASHSVSHELLPGLSDEALAHEVIESRRLIEERLGAKVTTFCYPNGSVDGRVRDAVEAAGYEVAVTTRWGDFDAQTDRMLLPRVDMEPDYSRTRSGVLSPAQVSYRLSRYHPRHRSP